jgi:hypothetical protein
VESGHEENAHDGNRSGWKPGDTAARDGRRYSGAQFLGALASRRRVPVFGFRLAGETPALPGGSWGGLGRGDLNLNNRPVLRPLGEEKEKNGDGVELCPLQRTNCEFA